MGPNNEGKSNILQALVTILEYLTSFSSYNTLYDKTATKTRSSLRRIPVEKESSEKQALRQQRFRLRNHHFGQSATERGYSTYVWERDFPLNLQNTEPNGKSEFSLRLELSKNEKKLLKESGEVVNSIIRINLDFSKDDWGMVAMEENVSKALSNSKLLRFLRGYLKIRYIDTIRTSATVKRVIRDTLEDEIEEITETTEYKQLMKKIEKLEQPVFNKLSKKLSSGAKIFMPSIRKITLVPGEPETSLESAPTVMVDDGKKTKIELKGDGIKSLLAISIIYESLKDSKNKNIILAIEEPESHLHPDAIHILKNVLMQLSEKNQVIITTHSPLLIDNYKISNNILVENSMAKPAKKISEIRNTLGVKLGDNLISARLVILTEGIRDIEILKAWVSKSNKIKQSIKDGTIVFDSLDGASNLSKKVDLYNAIGVSVYSFLDKDLDGLNAVKMTNSVSYVTFAGNSRQKESEIEDMVKKEYYSEYVKQKHNIDLNNKKFNQRKTKWSKRLKSLCLDNGCDDKSAKIIIDSTKAFISDEVSTKLGFKALKTEYRPCINSFIRKLENYLKEK